MLSSAAAELATVPLIAILTGVLLPWAGMRMIAPSLETPGNAVRNYRGREVYPGLGLVWVFWAAGVALWVAGRVILQRFAETGVATQASGVSGELALLAVLVFGGFAFGLIDDALGTSEHRGFRGHLRELARGRLSTGVLKLVGIGVLALFAGLIASEMGYDHVHFLGSRMLSVLPAAAVIALSANTVNLLDVRPGRALKGYAALAIVGLGSMAWLAMADPGVASGVDSSLGAKDILSMTAFAVGPVIAVWRYDLGERFILGDAGANAAGMHAGALIAIGLPTIGLMIVAALLLGLNLVSERVSFSAVIERIRPLAWLDSLGRLPEDRAEREK